MQSIDILIYTATVAIVAISVPLTIVLWRLASILKEAKEVIEYARHVQSLLQSWEQLPFMLIKKVFEFFR